MTSRLKDSSLVSSTSSKEELERFTLEALREYLKKHSLATTGTKEVIIKRIREQKDVEEEVESKENSHPNLSGILPILLSSITTSTPPLLLYLLLVQHTSPPLFLSLSYLNPLFSQTYYL